jgi:low affinity Fe/Cu permease
MAKATTKTKRGGSSGGKASNGAAPEEHGTLRQGPLEWFASAATAAAGTSWALVTAVAIVVVWAITGPMFDYSERWQLIINTGTTIVTFLMVFLIQRSQNKDSRAVHLKLNELIAALQGASNRLLNLEDLSEEKLKTLHRHYEELSRLAQSYGDITESHSVEEAQRRHDDKHPD